jgi:hypothetical protein
MYCDRRLGPPRWYCDKPKGADLRLPDYVKTTVCFLCVESAGKTLYGGTGFFLSIRSTVFPESINFTYLVTAKHCVTKAYSKYKELKIRLNRADRSQADLIPIPNDWSFAEDPGVDVAVMGMHIDTREHEALCLVVESSVTDEASLAFGIGIGDETTTVGLFTQRQGTKINIPILRSGIISAMPEEVLYESKTGAWYHAYLIEMRSISGLSGSPVLVSVPSHRALGLNKDRPNDGYSMLLGLIRGHWEVDNAEDDFAVDDFITEGRMNSGIARVTPIQEVIKVIVENPRLKKTRELVEKEFANSRLAVDDSVFGDDPRPFTKADFEDALKRASRRIQPSQPDEGKSKT